MTRINSPAASGAKNQPRADEIGWIDAFSKGVDILLEALKDEFRADAMRSAAFAGPGGLRPLTLAGR